jgi:hypothetical protein
MPRRRPRVAYSCGHPLGDASSYPLYIRPQRHAQYNRVHLHNDLRYITWYTRARRPVARSMKTLALNGAERMGSHAVSCTSTTILYPAEITLITRIYTILRFSGVSSSIQD